MSSRGYFQSVLSNSLAIRQEIQRFESVHPSIYAIYDLIDLIPDGSVAQQIRDHVVCIEDSFVNSQEWTLSRAVPDLRLGIVGSLSSGKSALVHRYLTGSYMQEESPEGGRFKKEIVIDNQNYLLLIRDEGGPPESQFTAWVDAVIFVFSLENESSFNAIYNYYTKMAHYKNSTDIPFILVGTQDAISENNPRVIDDSRAKKLANDLRRCPYYETCATYGLNVERVFQDACQKIMQQRLSLSASCLTPKNSRPSTPNNTFHLPAAEKHFATTPQSTDVINNSAMNNLSPSHNYSNHKDFMNAHNVLAHRQTYTISSPVQHIHRQTDKDVTLKSCMEKWNSSSSTLGSYSSTKGLEPQISIQQENNNTSKIITTPHLDNAQSLKSSPKEAKDFLTPSSTPTTSRKNRRKSNLFTASKKVDEKLRNCGDFGSGRAIPLKQGYLYKKSSKPLNKEWKKKYVTLCDNGRLTYHPSLHDYMDDVHGKEISLQYVTVKVPGQKPRGSKSITTVTGTNGTNNIIDGFNGISVQGKDRCATEKVLLSALETVKDPNWKSSQASGDESISLSNSNSFLNGGTTKTESSNVKKRHRRMKSSGVKNSEYDDSDDYEFYIVSLDNKQWHFEASSLEERDEWVSVIEQQILNSLQLSELFQVKKQSSSTETSTLQSIRTRIPGNGVCVDCDAANPDWASLNLGVLMCIECSGIHRNLGSHISKVRSLDLDKWPPGHLSVMLAVGNSVANSVWEYNTQGRTKPTPESSHEEKEQWIRWKYESKDFLPPPNNTMPLGQQLVDVVCSANIKSIIHVLAQVSLEHVNSTVSPRDLRTPLHLSCAMGNLAVAQLLIWHNADVNSVDQDGRTPLAYARAALSIALTKSQVSGVFSSDANVASCRNLIELLTSHGCTEVTTSISNTASLLRRRGSQSMTQMEKLPSSII